MAVFHLNNKEAKRELEVNDNNETLPFFSEPIGLPRSNVGQDTHVSPTPRDTSQVDITPCALEAACWLWLGCWSNNVANSHHIPGLFSSRVLRSCLVSQCSHPPPTPADNLPIRADIQPDEFCRKGATLFLARCLTGPGHLGGNTRHLKSRHPFVPAAQQLISSFDDNNISATLWADHRWDAEML